MTDKILSSLIGGALGDALGYQWEFDGYELIKANLPGQNWRNARLGQEPFNRFLDRQGKSLISDDTQMTIATGRALAMSGPDPAPSFADSFADNLSREYVYWSKSPENTRAPGMACMRACRNLDKGLHWSDATDINTMGCGANMRVAPIALAHDLGESPVYLAYLSSAITHAHPAALASAALTVQAISGARDGMDGREILDMLLDTCRAPGTYPTHVLGDLWEQSEYVTAPSYLRAGYARCRTSLLKVKAAFVNGWKGQTDPCTITGEGWTAPEALAGAMLCTVALWDNPVEVIQRAAVSNGDSDSLAAIAGNIRGAAGVEWPTEWVDALEPGPVAELRQLTKNL